MLPSVNLFTRAGHRLGWSFLNLPSWRMEWRSFKTIRTALILTLDLVFKWALPPIRQLQAYRNRYLNEKNISILLNEEERRQRSDVISTNRHVKSCNCNYSCQSLEMDEENPREIPRCRSSWSRATLISTKCNLTRHSKRNTIKNRKMCRNFEYTYFANRFIFLQLCILN